VRNLIRFHKDYILIALAVYIVPIYDILTKNYKSLGIALSLCFMLTAIILIVIIKSWKMIETNCKHCDIFIKRYCKGKKSK
jgi:hypothetical protein